MEPLLLRIPGSAPDHQCFRSLGYQVSEELKMEEPASIPELPEDCYAKIISLSTPQDACTAAQVSSGFRSAADSDLVWGKFLPEDYKDIISNSITQFSQTDLSSKKKLFSRMCNPVFFDKNEKFIKLDKRSGKKCITIGARKLSITWSDTSEYWKWEPHALSNFAEVAILLNVCWLHIKGYVKTRTLSPKTIYGAYLLIKFTNNTSSLEEEGDVWVCFENEGGIKSATRRARLKRPNRISPGLDGVQFPSDRGDQWMELELGEFYIDDGDDEDVSMYLHILGNWKRGLIVEGIEVRPKTNSQLVIPAVA